MPSPTTPADSAPPLRLLTVAEAAEHLSLSTSFLNKARLTGSGPRFVKLGARVFYRLADLGAWVEANIFNTTAEAEAAPG